MEVVCECLCVGAKKCQFGKTFDCINRNYWKQRAHYERNCIVYPTTNGGIRTLHTHFCTFGTDVYAQSVLINKISALELSRKFTKSALLVGYYYNVQGVVRCCKPLMQFLSVVCVTAEKCDVKDKEDRSFLTISWETSRRKKQHKRT